MLKPLVKKTAQNGEVMRYDGNVIQIPVVPHSGGSFKNRKPIGEVGCCELQTAEGRY